MQKSTALVVVAVAIIGFSGCKKGKKASGDESTKGQTAEAMGAMDAMGARPARRRAAAPKVAIDPAFAKAVKAAAEGCPKFSGIDKCPAYKPVKAFQGKAGAEALKILVSALGTISSAPPKQASVALYTLYYVASDQVLKASLRKHPDKVSKELVQAVLGKLETLDKYALTWGISPLAKLAGFTGLAKEILEVALKLAPKGRYLPLSAVKAVMYLGRMKAFPAVKVFATKPGGATKYSTYLAAALKAPLGMYKWTEPEFKVLCPWAEQYLLSDDLAAASSAGQIVVRCKKLDPAYIEKLLAAGRKRITTKPETWKNPVDFPFRNPCFGGFFGGFRRALKKTAAAVAGKRPTPKKPGVPEICKKTYDFLVWVTKQKGVSDDMKARAVMWISYQERTKYALKWLRKLKRSRNKAVRKEAKKQIAWLKKSYLKKKKK